MISRHPPPNYEISESEQPSPAISGPKTLEIAIPAKASPQTQTRGGDEVVVSAPLEKKRKFSHDEPAATEITHAIAEDSIGPDVAAYLESVYAQHGFPPTWILATLHQHLGIDIHRLQLWFKRKQMGEHKHRRVSSSSCAVDAVTASNANHPSIDAASNTTTCSSTVSAATVGATSATASASKPLRRQSTSRRSKKGDTHSLQAIAPKTINFSLDFIHNLVAMKQSQDVNAFMLQKYGHSLQYLVMNLFSHDASLVDGVINLDSMMREPMRLVEKFGESAADLVQILYHRVCDLESSLIYMSVDEYARELRIAELEAEVARLSASKISNPPVAIRPAPPTIAHPSPVNKQAVITVNKCARQQPVIGQISAASYQTVSEVNDDEHLAFIHSRYLNTHRPSSEGESPNAIPPPPPPIQVTTTHEKSPSITPSVTRRNSVSTITTSAPTTTTNSNNVSPPPLKSGHFSYDSSSVPTPIGSQTPNDTHLKLRNTAAVSNGNTNAPMGPIPSHELEALVACIEAAEKNGCHYGNGGSVREILYSGGHEGDVNGGGNPFAGGNATYLPDSLEIGYTAAANSHHEHSHNTRQSQQQ